MQPDSSSRRDLVERTFKFALDVLKFVDSLPSDYTSKTLGHQLVRSATSVGANYRSTQRARSTAEFVAKLGVVTEEADESCYWIEMLIRSGRTDSKQAETLLLEAKELTAIFTAACITSKRNSRSRRT